MTDYGQAGTEQQPPAHATAGPPGGAGPRSAAPGRPQIVAAVATALSRSTRRWAWQGPTGAADSWLTDTGPKDLDLWYEPGPPDADPVALIRQAFPCARVATADDPR